MTPIRIGAVWRSLLPLVTILTLVLLGAVQPAQADCVLNGVVVTCSGSSPGGFAAAPGVNGLTVNVLQGANVGTGVSLNDNNIVSNLGTVAVGDTATAVTANNASSIVNSGSVQAGSGGTGIQIHNAGSVSNTGQIKVGDGGFGILGDNNNRISNSGTINFGGCGSIGTSS